MVKSLSLLYIQHTNPSELIIKVYTAQKLSPVVGDWINLLAVDKEQFGIQISDEEVSKISEEKFKSFVKQKSVELTVQYLERLKKKNSKSLNLDVTDMKHLTIPHR